MSLHKVDAIAHQPPRVSICTVTYNRAGYLPLLQQHILNQTYPRERMEWVIVDDSDDQQNIFTPDPSKGLTIHQERLPQKLRLGEKRNLSHALCSGDIIVYMDDDDYYPPTRVSHAVKRLLASQALIAGSTVLPILFIPEMELWIAGPYGKNHATAGTFAFKRELIQQSRYDETKSFAEEKSFLKDYSLAMEQLDPRQTIICIAHDSNTFEKRKLASRGENPRFRRIGKDDLEKSKILHMIEEFIPQYKELASKQSTPRVNSTKQPETPSFIAPHNMNMGRELETSTGAIKAHLQTTPTQRQRPKAKSTEATGRRLIVVTPFHNCEKYIANCINSLKAQRGCQPKVILCDDKSDDDSKRIAEELTETESCYTLIANDSNQGYLYSINQCLAHFNPNPLDIIVCVDGDDQLIGSDALSVVADAYEECNCWLTYGSFITDRGEKRGHSYDQRTIRDNHFRSAPWLGSHLKTFYYALWQMIDQDDLRDPNGTYFKQATDLAFMLPMLEMAGYNQKFISDTLYLYNTANPASETNSHKSLQVQAAKLIKSKPRYQPLANL